MLTPARKIPRGGVILKDYIRVSVWTLTSFVSPDGHKIFSYIFLENKHAINATVKLILHSLRNGTFYRSSGVWVYSCKDAANLGNKGRALSLLSGEKLSDFCFLVLSEKGALVSAHHAD